jgi:hypothetical protein
VPFEKRHSIVVRRAVFADPSGVRLIELGEFRCPYGCSNLRPQKGTLRGVLEVCNEGRQRQRKQQYPDERLSQTDPWLAPPMAFDFDGHVICLKVKPLRGENQPVRA